MSYLSGDCSEGWREPRLEGPLARLDWYPLVRLEWLDITPSPPTPPDSPRSRSSSILLFFSSWKQTKIRKKSNIHRVQAVIFLRSTSSTAKETAKAKTPIMTPRKPLLNILLVS